MAWADDAEYVPYVRGNRRVFPANTGAYDFDTRRPVPQLGTTLEITNPPTPEILSTASAAPQPTLGEIEDRIDALNGVLNRIEDTLVAYTPPAADVTKISGAVIIIAASATPAALTLGRAHEITGSVAQTMTVATPTVNGTIVNLKVAEAYTGPGVTMPTGMTQAGVVTAGQDYNWQWDGAAWNIQ